MRAIIQDEQKTDAIAHRLGIKRRSVDMQLKHLYDKLGVQSRVGLAVRVFTGF